MLAHLILSIHISANARSWSVCPKIWTNPSSLACKPQAQKISTKHFLSPTLQMANMELERSTATLHPTLFRGENTVTQNKSLSLKVLQCL